METTTVQNFYQEVFGGFCPEVDSFLNEHDNHDIGHFNVFDIAEMYRQCKGKPPMPYNRRTYYKISLISGKNHAEYADRTVDIDGYAILFATPKVPYNYVPQNKKQGGHFCIFTKDFLAKSSTGHIIDEFPIFKPSSEFIYKISAKEFKEIEGVYKKMHQEIISDYPFKYDLLRNYVMELIHYGQKLKPMGTIDNSINASTRISTLFIELLERQFPIESPTQILQLKTAADYADSLRIHVNHLNKTLKDLTGKTTSEIIAGRITQEAKVLLKQTNWNVSEIAYSLGFQEVAHFSNFFKKNTTFSPVAYRE